MRWSFRILRVGETEVRIHLTLLAFMAWYAWMAWSAGGGLDGAAGEIAFLGLLFLSVLLHEFGHIFAARRYRIPTPEILLTPIGGIARIARMPDKPAEELVVALAGPAVTVAIILGLGATLTLGGQGGVLEQPVFVDAPLLRTVFWTNVVLLAFNLIPAFPMDGGRVLRALLAMKLGLLRGTRIAARIGQAFAFGLAIVGWQTNPMLILIAVFVFFGAEAEFAAVRNRQLGAQLTALGLVVTDVRPVAPGMRLDDAIRMLTTLDQRAFPVTTPEGLLVGILSRDDMLRGVVTHGLDAPVAAVMHQPDPELVIPVSLPFDLAVQRLFASGREALPAVDESGRFAGLITRDNVTDVLLVQRLRADMAERARGAQG